MVGRGLPHVLAGACVAETVTSALGGQGHQKCCWPPPSLVGPAEHRSAPSHPALHRQTTLGASSQREARHFLCYWSRIPIAMIYNT